jgi:hypothetical protein
MELKYKYKMRALVTLFLIFMALSSIATYLMIEPYIAYTIYAIKSGFGVGAFATPKHDAVVDKVVTNDTCTDNIQSDQSPASLHGLETDSSNQSPASLHGLETDSSNQSPASLHGIKTDSSNQSRQGTKGIVFDSIPVILVKVRETFDPQKVPGVDMKYTIYLSKSQFMIINQNDNTAWKAQEDGTIAYVPVPSTVTTDDDYLFRMLFKHGGDNSETHPNPIPNTNPDYHYVKLKSVKSTNNYVFLNSNKKPIWNNISKLDQYGFTQYGFTFQSMK